MTSSQAFRLSEIGQVSVPVQDLDRAVAFYRDTLGIKFLFQVPNMAFFDCDGIRLLLGVPEDPEDARRASLIYYKVDDLEKTCELLAGRGVDFVSKPHLAARMEDHELWIAFFRDSEGNTLGLMSEVSDSSLGEAEL
jgi:predicted enzyme related to lactoylglutathione lyase